MLPVLECLGLHRGRCFQRGATGLWAGTGLCWRVVQFEEKFFATIWACDPDTVQLDLFKVKIENAIALGDNAVVDHSVIATRLAPDCLEDKETHGLILRVQPTAKRVTVGAWIQ